MLYLIEYHRSAGRLVDLREFSDPAEAESERLELELRLNHEKTPHEVVVLEADSTQDLKHSHGRYFELLSALTDRILEYPAKRV